MKKTMNTKESIFGKYADSIPMPPNANIAAKILKTKNEMLQFNI